MEEDLREKETVKVEATSKVVSKETVKVEATSKVLSKVDALLLHYKEISPVKKAPDDIAEIERRLLAIVGSREQVDKEPDFEKIVDDEEMFEPGGAEDAASRMEVENANKNSDENIRDIKKVQAELIKME